MNKAIYRLDAYLRSNPLTMYISLMAWKVVDFVRSFTAFRVFGEYGITVYTGRQGTGKTISMVRYMEHIKRKYPNCIIVSNFACKFSDQIMTSWEDFYAIRNGSQGVLFALDELQSEWNSLESKKFPVELLGEMCQQRKQRIKIVATTQVFGRMAKPLREQSYEVVTCSTYFGRLTVNHYYDAYDYERVFGSLVGEQSLKPLYTKRFVQSDDLRSAYQTTEKVQTMKKVR